MRAPVIVATGMTMFLEEWETVGMIYKNLKNKVSRGQTWVFEENKKLGSMKEKEK